VGASWTDGEMISLSRPTSWIRLGEAWGLRPVSIFDLISDRLAGDFGFQGGLKKGGGGSELAGVSDNLCLLRGGAVFLDLREFHGVLTFGNYGEVEREIFTKHSFPHSSLQRTAREMVLFVFYVKACQRIP